MSAGPAFSQFDWSKASLSMDLPVFLYSHTKTIASNFFQDREDTGQLFIWLVLSRLLSVKVYCIVAHYYQAYFCSFELSFCCKIKLKFCFKSQFHNQNQF